MLFSAHPFLFFSFVFPRRGPRPPAESCRTRFRKAASDCERRERARLGKCAQRTTDRAGGGRGCFVTTGPAFLAMIALTKPNDTNARRGLPSRACVARLHARPAGVLGEASHRHRQNSRSHGARTDWPSQLTRAHAHEHTTRRGRDNDRRCHDPGRQEHTTARARAHNITTLRHKPQPPRRTQS